MAQQINVDIKPGLFQPTLHFSQGDIGREFAIKIVTSDGFSVPVGATVDLVGTKPSGFGFTVPCTVSGNTVSFTSSNTDGEVFTDEHGIFPAELVIKNNGDVIGTANFFFSGEKNPHPAETIDGEAEQIIPELTLLVERVETAASSVLDMQVVADTLPAGSDATYSYDEETNTATFGIPKGADGSLASGVLAPTYSSSETYSVGGYVYYSGDLYRCITAITTAEAWTAGHWTKVAIAQETKLLNSDLENIEKNNILFRTSSETVSGSGTYVNKNIDIVSGIEAGKRYTLKIGNIVGGTSSYLVYLRTLDASNNVIENQSSGSTTTNATCSIVATNNTAKLRITLYPATTTPMPSGKATYTDIVLFKGTSIEYSISDAIKYDRMDEVEYIAGNAVPFVTGKNIFNGYNSNNLTDTLVTDGGAVTANSAFSSVFLPVEGGKNIVSNFAYSRYSFYTSYNDLTKLSVGDNLAGYISGVIPTSVGQVVPVPANARYICVGYSEDRIDTMQIEYGTTVTTFEKYCKGVPESEIIPLTPTVINVFEDGSGDYANIRAALESITDAAYNKPYEVHVHEGIYDIASLFTPEEIAQQSNQGLFVPDYVTLVGIGNKENIVLECTLTTANQYFSPLHFRNHGGMKNITVEATKCRYVVHDDIAVNGLGSERLVENCKFIGHSLYYACVYGSGMKEDSHWTFKDCVFDATEAAVNNTSGIAFLSHNSLDWTKPSEITIEDCRMLNTPTEGSPNSYAIRLRTLNSYNGHTANNMPIYVHLYGNMCNGIELREDESGTYGIGILTYVDGFYNKNAYEHITTAGTEIPTSDRFNLL